MKKWFFFLGMVGILAGCSDSNSERDTNYSGSENNGTHSSVPLNEVSFDIALEELYGNWVLIGVGADSIGPGTAPYSEIFFAFREDGNMTVATEGIGELQVNLEEIPSPYALDGKSICSDDVLFTLQFGESCVEIVRLNGGRMSIEIELSEGGTMYKHFVKVDN